MIYVVEKGDTLSGIAVKFGAPVWKIVYDNQLKDKNHIFITLCEVSPGIIWAGGYTSGIYKINKADLSVEYFSPYLLSHINMRPDKYIRDMINN